MRKTISILGLFILFPIFVLAQKQPEGFLISTVDKNFCKNAISITRSYLDLNGDWLVSFDEDESPQKVKIPCSYIGNNSLVFSRKFNIDKQKLTGINWKLVCGSIPYRATIILNGFTVGKHEGEGKFEIPIYETGKLLEKNVIEIKVDNYLDYNTSPCRKTPLESKTYAGIVRDIGLIGCPSVSIDEIKYNTYLLDSNVAKTKFDLKINASNIKGLIFGNSIDSGGPNKILLDNAEFTALVYLKKNDDTSFIKDTLKSEVKFSLTTNHSINIGIDVTTISPKVWSFESPNLYEATVKILYNGSLVDVREFKLGLKTIAVKKNEVLFNGKKLLFKGIGYVIETDKGGQTIINDLISKDLKIIKQSGANLVKFIGGTPNEFVLDLCDELGLMTLIDAQIGMPPSSQFRNEVYISRSLDVVSNIVMTGLIHTSTFGYGLSALIPESETALKVIKIIKNITSSSGKFLILSAQDWNKDLLSQVDIIHIPTLDIPSDDLVSKISKNLSKINNSKPVIITFGKLCQLGNHNGYADPLSIEAQAKYINDAYNVILKQNCLGSIYWTFNDYKTDRPLLTVKNNEEYIFSAGLNDLFKNPRQSLSMLRSLFTESTQPIILVGDYEEPSTITYIIVGILCAVLSIVMLNKNSRFRQDMMRAFLRPSNFFNDIRDQRILSTIQTISLGGVLAIIMGVAISSLCYYYRTSENFDTLLSVLVKSDQIKELVNQIVWVPIYSILFFTLLFLLGLLIVSSKIFLVGLVLKKNVTFSDSFVISTWSALPTLILTPFIMFLYRLLSVNGLSGIIVGLLIIIGLWVLYRLYKGASIVYNTGPFKFFTLIFAIFTLLIIILYFSSSYFQSVISYLREGIGGLYI